MSFLRNIPIVRNFLGGGEDEQPAPPARSALSSTHRRSGKTRAPYLRIMAANLVNEDLWEKVILQAGPGEIPALNREMARALRRDTLYKAFAARRAPRLWGALGAAPPGRDRFRRAVLLESDMVGPVGPRGTGTLQPWTCIVVVTQGDAEVFRARCPFVARPAEDDFYGGGAQLVCAVQGIQHGVDATQWGNNPIPLDLEINTPFSAEAGPALNSSPSPYPDSLTITYLVERADGRVAKLLTFGSCHFTGRDCMSREGDEGFELMTWYEQDLGTANGPDTRTRWTFKLVFSVVFPGYGDGSAFEPEAPWEGLVSSFELHASNRPATVDWSKYESQRAVSELHSWIVQLAWR